MNPTPSHTQRRSTRVTRNERMTALAGAVLFVLILVELVVTANLHALISVHIFVGMLLFGPLVVKLCSTGYRFYRYYSKSPVFVQKGPPHILLRLLAPVLVFMTIVVLVSGCGLAIVGPNHAGWFLKVHAVSVCLWLPLIAVHILAHIRRASRFIASDWSKRDAKRVSGRAGRLRLNIMGLVTGAIAAVVMIPISAPWDHWHIHPGLPSPLVAGILAAACAILIAIPLFRKTNLR
ncbi:hypothetical protein [Alicyclobacillus fastidiosus]|uniref:DUF4405 domain-containing protein n=1 Tax=Alicyclobacillus fastidiosus TaxID=392011 RepID=A0ABV5ADJ9_9BACL|nr:hypothetical protein [Alicyclobacillus fastidiosus]WEH11371.1 hypothetical protein PYS47_09235 [Alicyclobacillus fastidiosus]